MGNCQAAEAATVVIQHPGGNKVERIYWSVSANEVMASNPGHYVALVLESPAVKAGNNATVKQLKLLRPDDTLLIGQVYRLISFEDVLKEFAAKKCVKLGKLLKERRASAHNNQSGPNAHSDSIKHPLLQTNSHEMQGESSRSNVVGSRSGGLGRHRGGQWRPALHSIQEIGT